MELDTWLLPYMEDHYECISVCADDLLVSSKDPKSAIDFLTNKKSFKFNVTGLISYHLGCDFGRDDDDALHFTPKKHIEAMVDFYYSMFGTKPKLSLSSPLEKGDRPELDTSEHLD